MVMMRFMHALHGHLPQNMLALMLAIKTYEYTIKLQRWQQLSSHYLSGIFSPVVEKGRTQLAYRNLQRKASKVRNPHHLPEYPVFYCKRKLHKK